MFVFLGSAVLDKWVRLKIVTIIELSVNLLAHIIILALMWPTNTNRFFPFHVRVAQIGTISDPDESDEEPVTQENDRSGSVPSVRGRQAAVGYRAPNNWNIFTGTADQGNVQPETESGFPPIRSNTYNLFTVKTSSEDTKEEQQEAKPIGNPRFSEVYGTDQL